MSASLSVLAPVTITDAMLTSSTAAENDYAIYDPTATYAVGARCISTVTHRIYECMIAGNQGHDPTDINNRAGTTIYWKDVAPTNKWAMFDNEASTQTIHASSLTVVLVPGVMNSIYLAGVDAELLTISMKDKPGGTVVYTASSSLEASAPADYYEYFFDRFNPQTDYLANDVPPYSAGELTVTLSRGSGNVAVGVLVVGDLKPLGETQYGAKAKPKTYSYINIDQYGNNQIVRGKSAKDVTATSFVDIDEANSILDAITALLDVPSVWVGTDLPQYTGLRAFGLGSAEMTYVDAETCELSLTVQGLI